MFRGKHQYKITFKAEKIAEKSLVLLFMDRPSTDTYKTSPSSILDIPASKSYIESSPTRSDGIVCFCLTRAEDDNHKHSIMLASKPHADASCHPTPAVIRLHMSSNISIYLSMCTPSCPL